MAVDFSKFNIFKNLDVRTRVFFLLAGLFGIILVIYLLSRFLFGGGDTTGPSRVATAPANLQSVQAGQLTPEYQRAVERANIQSAEQARMTGGTAIPTVINYGAVGAANCIVCSDDMVNIKSSLDDWVKQGSITPEVAAALQGLADRNVSEDEFANALNDLVKQGRLTPEQARQLLEQYRKQHANRLLQDSAKVMDPLTKAGKLPVDAANALLDAQRRRVSANEYADLLRNLERQGRITPAVSQQLLTQYSQLRAKDIILRSLTTLRQMTQAGQITPDVLRELEAMETKLVGLDVFTTNVQGFVTAGKMTPAVAAKVIEEYQQQKAEIGGDSVGEMLRQAEAAAYQEIADLLREGKITSDVAQTLTSMLQRDVSREAFQATINQLVAEKKLTPEIAKLKTDDFQLVKGLRELNRNLNTLKSNNALPNDYANELKRGVAAGLLTPEQAARLMQDYLALTNRGAAPAATGTDEFAKFQQRVAEGGAAAALPTQAEFAVAETQAVQETNQDRLNRIQNLIAGMSGQAQQLISAWQPPVMQHREGAPPTKGKEGEAGAVAVTEKTTKGGPGELGVGGIPLIKAGTILFAVLDTQANSDYPDSPILATIVDGKYKGAKLLGKLVTTKGVSGQLDRISLNFTLMNMDQWDRSKTVTAYAIDPDTARSVMASSVNYHYLKRFGAMMATSFLQGYASAITTSSSTSTTGIFGTSTTHPELDPRQKFMVGLGQVGQTLGAATQNWINIPPTVKVDSGVGLGILFMSDVS